MAEDPSLFMAQDDTWLIALALAPMLIFYLLGIFGVGIIAVTKGRSFWRWMLLSLVVTPIVAGFIVFVLDPLPVIKRTPPPM
jgi:MFS family permease